MGDEEFEYLKQSSRIKHQILKKYLAPWATILGSAHPRLGYVDCFAGRGAFVDEQNEFLPGSPLIALRTAKEYVARSPGRCVSLWFSEKDRATAERLRSILASEGGISGCVEYYVEEEDAQEYVERILSIVSTPGATAASIPTFFFVDPYGHPITLAAMRKLVQIEKTEVLVNLMWFRLNMDLNNPQVQRRLDHLFGHSDWRSQSFVTTSGANRERAFVDYFVGQVGGKYQLRFAMPFSPEDRVKGKQNRQKFYLVHFSAHPRAALLMKDVMWAATEEAEELRFTGPGGATQLRLFDEGPDNRGTVRSPA